MGLQCKGITKNGSQCKLTGSFENGYCHLHKNQYTAAKPNASIHHSDSTASEISSPSHNQDPSDTSRNNTPGCFLKIMAIICVITITIALFKTFQKK